jgi:hypothetical protein
MRFLVTFLDLRSGQKCLVSFHVVAFRETP